MNRFFTNLIFISSFLVVFTILGLTFSDDFIEALSPDLFPKDESLDIAACQQWTERVRDFEVQHEQKAKNIPVLMYHRVIDDADLSDVHYEENGLLQKTIIPRSEFMKQMEYLKQEEYTTLTAKEFQLFMEGKLDIPEKSVLLTFDDGYQDNVTEVYPILKQYHFNALNFVITGALNKRGQEFNPSKHQYLSKEEIQESCDVFEFQSHTYNFHKKTEEDQAYLVAKTEEKIKQDISYSLVNLDNHNRSFAYPYGLYDDETIDVLRTLGFEMAFTTEYKKAVPGMDMYKIPRIEVFPEDTILDFANKIK